MGQNTGSKYSVAGIRYSRRIQKYSSFESLRCFYPLSIDKSTSGTNVRDASPAGFGSIFFRRLTAHGLRCSACFELALEGFTLDLQTADLAVQPVELLGTAVDFEPQAR